MKIKLYIDFDGVILDTITTSYQMMEEEGIDWKKPEDPKTIQFFQNLDWKKIIEISSIINDSIDCINKLIQSNLYDISILTHVNSDNEIQCKKIYMQKFIPDIKMIFVPAGTPKSNCVDAQNAILVDDFIVNLKDWEQKGGIPIKFSTTGKTYSILSISRLDKLIDKYKEIQKLIKLKSEK